MCFKEDEDMQYKQFIIGGLVILVACCCISFITRETTNFSDSTNSENNKAADIFNKINNKNYSCESEDVKNLVINIFEENDEFYKAINKNTISDIKLLYPAAQSYDSSIGKYDCTGQIVMSANGVAFAPIVQNWDNAYYHFVKHFRKYLSGYDTYKINVRYSSQMSEGNILVQVPDYDLKGNGKFSCQKSSCEGIIDEEEQKEEIKRQEKRIQYKKDNEQMILPTFEEVQ